MTAIQIFNARPEHEFKRQTVGASGFDLCANLGMPRTIDPGRRWIVPTGIHVAMPLGVEAQVRGRSGLAANHGVVAAPGTVDADYRGEIRVTLFNLGEMEFVVRPGMRIGQLVFAPVIVPRSEDVEDGGNAPIRTLMNWSGRHFTFVTSLADLPPSERGASGHGSTGLGGGK